MPNGGSPTPGWYLGIYTLTTVSETGRTDTICLLPPCHSILIFLRQEITEEPFLLGLENPKMRLNGRSGVCVRDSQEANEKIDLSVEL